MTNSKTMIWKRMNYTSGKRIKNTPGINQLKTSLEHSLRLIQKDDLEFNKDLIDKNAVYFDGKTKRMDQLSIEDRQSMFNSIYSPLTLNKSDKKELVAVNTELSKYAYKIKKLIVSNEDEVLTNFLTGLLNSEIAVDVNSSGLIGEMGVKRVKQKVDCVDKYIKLKNKSIELSNNIENDFSLKKTVVQEAFWKFPIHQLVDEVKPAHYMSIINGFYKKHLPDYPVKLIVFHGDEITNSDDVGLGAHPHIFIDGKNSKTGKLDLINDEFKMVNNYLINQGKEPIEGRKFTSAQLLGKTYQQMVYAHVNEELKKLGYDISVEVLPDTPAKKIRNKLIQKDTSKPKIYRLYNSINKGIEDLEKINQSLEANKVNKKKLEEDIAKILDTQKTAQSQNTKLFLANDKLKSNIEENTGIVESLNASKKDLENLSKDIISKSNIIKSKEAEIFELDIKIEAKKSYYEKLEDAFSSVKNFVTACIHRHIRYDEKRPPKHRIEEVNTSLNLIYDTIKGPEGLELIDKMLDEQEQEFEKNDVPVKFQKGTFVNRDRRLAKLK
ncbi:TPA: hypothetical protein QEM55_005199 [Pseudomonas putida]|nr:hypothetical protein [Pseudomonas putida]